MMILDNSFSMASSEAEQKIVESFDTKQSLESFETKQSASFDAKQMASSNAERLASFEAKRTVKAVRRQQQRDGRALAQASFNAKRFAASFDAKRTTIKTPPLTTLLICTVVTLSLMTILLSAVPDTPISLPCILIHLTITLVQLVSWNLHNYTVRNVKPNGLPKRKRIIDGIKQYDYIRGAQFQNNEVALADPVAENLTPQIEEGLRQFGISGYLAISLATGFIAIILGIWALILLVKQNSNKNSKIIKITVASLVLQITSFLSQIFSISFQDKELPNLKPIVASAVTDLLSTDYTTVQEGINITRAQGDYKSACDALEKLRKQFGVQANYVPNIPDWNIACFATPSSIEADVYGVHKAQTTRLMIEPHFPAIQFWTPTTCAKLWNLGVYERRVFNASYTSYKNRGGFASSDSDSEVSENEYPKALPRPLKPKAHTSAATYLKNAKHEIDAGVGGWSGMLRKMCNTIAGLIVSCVVAVILCGTGKSIDLATISRNWGAYDFLSGKAEDVVMKFKEQVNGETPKEAMERVVGEHVAFLTEALEHPMQEYTADRALRENFFERVTEVEKFLKVSVDPKLIDKTILGTIFVQALSLKTSISKAMRVPELRVETRAYVLYGEGGASKTKLMQRLAWSVGERLFPHVDPAKRTKSIPPHGKYWPHLAGEKVLMFDEIAGCTDFTEEILLRDVRGICSSAPFEAPTAAIDAKEQFLESEVILATTNTHPNDIMMSIANRSGAEAIGPCAQRMYFYQMSRNTRDYEKITTRNRETARYDKTGGFKHVWINRMEYDPITQKYVVDPRDIAIADVEQDIVNRHNALRIQYQTGLQEKAKLISGATPQVANARRHFVLNLHGLPNTGKGRACDEILAKVQQFTRYPIVRITDSVQIREITPYNRRQIVVVDDYLRIDRSQRSDQEADLMYLYNSLLPDGSIIIFMSNLIPGNSFPKFTVVPDKIKIFGYRLPWIMITAQPIKTLDLSEPGLLRRIGFTGKFRNNNTHCTDLSYYVSDGFYYKQPKESDCKFVTFPIMTGLLLTIIVALFHLIGAIIVLCLLLAYLYFSVNGLHCGVFDRAQLYHETIKAYNNFLNVSESVNLIYSAAPADVKPVIRVHCAEYGQLATFTTPYSIASHVYQNSDHYAESTQAVKIYIKPSSAAKLMNAIPRFISKFPEKTIESVTKALQEMAIMLKEVGEDCCAELNITELGRFVLYGNTIYCDCRCVEETKAFFTFEEQAVIVWPVYDMSRQDCDEEWMAPSRLTWDTVLNFHLNGEKGVEMTQCSLRKQDFLARALHDPQVVMCKQYRHQLARYRENRLKDRLMVSGQAFMTEFKGFVSTTTGKICMGLLTAIILISASVGLYCLLKEKDEDKTAAYDNEPLDCSDPWGLYWEAKKRSNKTKRRPLSGDEQRGGKRGVGNKRRRPLSGDENSEDDKMKHAQAQTRMPMGTVVPQSIKELPDMNGYDEFRNALQDVEKSVSKNLCFVTVLPETKDRLDFKDKEPMHETILSGGRCYGLFVKGRNLITVGHICKLVKGNKNMYVSSDEFGLKLYKAKLLKSFQQDNRDLSVWTLESNEYAKHVPEYRDISNKFWKDFASMEDYCTTIMKRFGPKKLEQFLYGTMWYEMEKASSLDGDGNPFSIDKYGVCAFSFATLALTTFGDCGLPYYNVTTRNAVYIPGIHCMGNVRNSFATGIVALVTQRDFACMVGVKTPQLKEEECPLCEETKDGFVVREAYNKKDDGATITINADHAAGPQSLRKEIEEHLLQEPEFVGKYRKSYGESAMGTEEHSHLHAVPNRYWDFTTSMKFDSRWYEEEAEPFGTVLVRRCDRSNVSEFSRLFERCTWIKEYTAYVNREGSVSKDGTRRRVKYEMEILVHKHTLTAADKKKLLESPVQQMGLEGFYITEEQEKIVHKAEKHLVEGITNDVPIGNRLEQNTVSLIGSFPTSKSHIPAPAYESIAGFSLTKLEPGKVPFEGNVKYAFPGEAENLEFNNTGTLCARTTQSLQWQGKMKGMSIILSREVKAEYKKALSLYQDLRVLSDHDVLYGTAGLCGLVLDKSIGFTLKTLFNVNLKKDVIQLDESGKYSWLDNDAARYAKKHYSDSVSAVQQQGLYPFNIYTEILKMEKLKPEKRMLGRIFCAADLNATLIERKFMGDFVSIACTQDKTVGVGANFWQIFNDMAIALREKDYYFTGDYKRWDKTVQEMLFVLLGECLDDLNTNKVNKLMLQGLANSVHVSGTTLFQKHIGMPSGSVLTATGNSKINDLALYIVFLILARQNGADESYEAYDKLVYRKYYGDDVIVGVSKEIASWFNMRNVKHYLAKEMGFVLDSSEKTGGQVQEFMDWEELSWCSRYFRKLKRYNYFVGALKKATIQSMLAWKKKHTDLVSLGAQITVAVFESAAWDEDYYNEIRSAANTIRKMNPGVENWVMILSYDEWQQEMYEEGLRARILRHVAQELESGLTTPETDLLSIQRKIVFMRNINKVESIEIASPLSIKMESQTEMTSKPATQELNEMFQKGEITHPEYDFVQKPDLSWICQASCAKVGWCQRMLTAMGVAGSKAGAKEIAAEQLLLLLNLRREFNIQHAHQEMDVSHGDQVPIVQTSSKDITVSGGTNIYTNTQFAVGTTDLNPYARSVNNIAQTGAPFDIKDSVFSIYREEQRTTVSAAQGVGTTIFKISLDPETRHAMQRSYIEMHKAHIPSIDIGIFINGASGAVGTIKVGFVTDATKDYTLDDLQDIASCDMSLNQPSTVSYSLHDIRKGDMYRDVKKDANPYPGIVAIISNPITNVNKNDIVPFPINIYTRLNSGYQLAQPSNPNSSGTTVVGDVDFHGYVPIANFDVTIGKNILCDVIDETVHLDDCGWNTGLFKPVFTAQNIVGIITTHFQNNETGLGCEGCPIIDDDTEKAIIADNQFLINKGMKIGSAVIEAFVFGFGECPGNGNIVIENNASDGDLPYSTGTYTTVPTAKLTIGDLHYGISTAILFPHGIALVAKLIKLQNKNGIVVIEDMNLKRPINVPGVRRNGEIAPVPLYYGKRNPDDNITLVAPGEWYQDGAPIKVGELDLVFGNGKVTAATPNPFTITWFVQPATHSFPFDQNLLKSWTFLMTGNFGTSSAAPTGLVELNFTRPGSSVGSNVPVNAPKAPGIQRLESILDNTRLDLKTEWLAMSFSSDSKSNDFELVFRNGVFLVRTMAENLIKISLNSRTSKLRNIRPVAIPNLINPFVSTNFNSWLAPSVVAGRHRLVAPAEYLFGAQRQMMAASMALGGIGGLASGMNAAMINQQQIDMMLKEQGLKKWAKIGDWQNVLDLDKQRFNNVLQMRGMTSLSAGAGNASNATQPTSSPPSYKTDSIASTAAPSAAYRANTQKQGEIADVIEATNRSMLPEHLPDTDSIGSATDLLTRDLSKDASIDDPSISPASRNPPPGLNPDAASFKPTPKGLNPNAPAFAPRAMQLTDGSVPGPSVPVTRRTSNTSTLSTISHGGSSTQTPPTNRIWTVNPLHSTTRQWAPSMVGSEVNTLPSLNSSIFPASNRISFSSNNSSTSV